MIFYAIQSLLVICFLSAGITKFYCLSFTVPTILIEIIIYAFDTMFLVFSGMVTLDLCASFTHSYEDKSITLVTPGYQENAKYPNMSYCQCDIQTLIPTSRDRSLNLTVQDLKLENCSESSTPYDTLTVRTAYSYQAL